MTKKYITIHFEDHGQDLLEWDIDKKTHQIVGCRPQQANLWVKELVTNFEELDVGSRPVVRGRVSKVSFLLKYPITKIEAHE